MNKEKKRTTGVRWLERDYAVRRLRAVGLSFYKRFVWDYGENEAKTIKYRF